MKFSGLTGHGDQFPGSLRKPGLADFLKLMVVSSKENTMLPTPCIRSRGEMGGSSNEDPMHPHWVVAASILSIAG
jgi:hypothetical protein